MAREVGVEGQLGGQAKVPGAAGTWKALTENVNQLAANLTTQVRAIAEVATAVTKGDLTRSIKVEALGEVAVLKDNINEMIRNLKDQTLKNSEQDWLKTNLAKFSRMLQGQKDLLTVGRLILSELAPVVAAQHAVFYVLDAADDAPGLKLLASYAHKGQDALGGRLALGEGLIGQCAVEKQKILLTNVPPDYIRISSGLGERRPAEHHRPAGRLRGPGQGRAGAGVVRALQPDAPGLPRPADRIDRHRAQHDRSQHADGGPAQAVAVAGPAIADPPGGIAEHQPGIAGEGRPAGPPEPGSRAEKSGSRTGPAGAGGQGQAAGAHLQVQVRVPRQHVARAADAAQQSAHPVRPAVAATRTATCRPSRPSSPRRSTRRATTC